MSYSDRRQRAALATFAFVVAAALAIALQSHSSEAASGDGGGSGAPAQLDGRHLYLVPAGAQGEAAIASTGARPIARYDAFTLVSAHGSADPALRAAGADRRDDMRTVAVADATLDPADEPSLNAGTGESLAVVQFVGPVKDAWLESLRKTGATVVTYMAQNAYIVYASGDESAALADFAADDAVRALTPFTAADKTAPGIAGSGTAKVAVETVAGAPGAAARATLAAGDELRPEAAFGGTITRFAAIDSGRVDELAADPGVVSVEPWVAPKLLDERAAEIVRGRLTAGGTQPVGPGYLAFLNAQGFPTTLLPFTVDITDEGLDKGVVPVPAGSHRDFYVNGNPASGEPDRLRAGGHDRFQRAGLRRARHQRRLDRHRLQHRRPAPTSRTPRASTTGSGSPRGHASARPRSSTAPGTSTSATELHGAALNRLRRRRADLQQLLGRTGGRRLQRRLARVRLPGPRRPARRRRATSRWSNVFSAGNSGLGREHDRRAGHGEERDHRGRLGERPPDRLHRRLRRSRTPAPTAPRTSSTSPAADRPTTAG